MRVVRDLARALVGLGIAGLLAAGCGSAERVGSPPPASSASSEEGRSAVFALASTAFADGDDIPVAYCTTGVTGGRNTSIPLTWTDAPVDTRSFAVVMIDRHPAANDWVHWAVVDIPASATGLAEGASGTAMPAGARELENTFGTGGYGGPQPPRGSGDHDYEITVYALDTDHLEIRDRPSAADVERALSDRVLASATIVGTFGR